MSKRDMFKDGVKIFGKGALEQINVPNALAAVGGTVVGKVIRGEEITAKSVISNASFAMTAVSVGVGAVTVLLNKDLIKQREEVRKQGIDPDSIV